MNLNDGQFIYKVIIGMRYYRWINERFQECDYMGNVVNE